MDKLTEKQKRFIDYYIKSGNATEAAREAGYKAKTDKAMQNIGSENLGKLGEYIQERIKELDDKRIASADEVLRYLTSVLRGEEKDQFGFEASLKDRNKAAELLGKRYALFTEKVEKKEEGNINIVFGIPRPPKENNDGNKG